MEFWTEQAVQHVLHHPEQLMTDATFRTIIHDAGGLDGFYQSLQRLPLKGQQKRLLSTILTYPNASFNTYCDLLHIHPTTFYRQRSRLAQQLAFYLNRKHKRNEEPPDDPAPTFVQRATHQLPVPLADFVGRQELLASCKQHIRQGTHIIGFCGMGGSGKTTLAIRLAQSLVATFPDAQIILPVYGSRLTPRSVEELLTSILAIFEAGPFPQDRNALYAYYCSLFHTKRAIIIVDDVADTETARWLIPSGENLLILTSRQHFLLPSMIMHSIGSLAETESMQLLQRICPNLTSNDRQQLHQVIGGLPLALRASATVLQTTPAITPTQYLHKLSDPDKQLKALRDPFDATLDVYASLNLSYQALNLDAQRAFRALSIIVSDWSSKLAISMLSKLGFAHA